MDKFQRLRAALQGGPLDRPPVALWRHFPVDDQDPTTLAAAVLEWQAQYDWDIVKVTPTSAYFTYGWGAEDVWRGNPEGTRDATRKVITTPADWLRLRPLAPDSEYLAASLSALDEVAVGLQGSAPFLQTIFSPLSLARKLVGPDLLATHVRQHPAEVKAALAVITESVVRYVEAAAQTGIAGIFYAMQFATTRVFAQSEYEEFGAPYDRQVLQAAAKLWLNVAHLHGEDVFFDLVAAYPHLHVINWHDLETPPDLSIGKEKFVGAVCGGLRQWETLAYGTPAQVRAEAQAAIDRTKGTRFILGTGCVAPIIAPRANLRAVRDAVE
jgi:uroporphyrinogen decarboxylase